MNMKKLIHQIFLNNLCQMFSYSIFFSLSDSYFSLLFLEPDDLSFSFFSSFSFLNLLSITLFLLYFSFSVGSIVICSVLDVFVIIVSENSFISYSSSSFSASSYISYNIFDILEFSSFFIVCKIFYFWLANSSSIATMAYSFALISSLNFYLSPSMFLFSFCRWRTFLDSYITNRLSSLF